jgi:hypothetical protein
MTVAAGLRLLGGYSEDELERIADECSEPIQSHSIPQSSPLPVFAVGVNQAILRPAWSVPRTPPES